MATPHCACHSVAWGKDFINPAPKLPGGMAVISIEPQPDNSSAPLALKPLINTNIANLVVGANPRP